MKRIIVALLLAALAGQGYATLGSVISSFFMFRTTEPGTYASGIYRDAEYVYICYQLYSTLYVQVFTPSGSKVGLRGGWYIEFDWPGDMTRGHLGSSSAAFSIIEADEIWITNNWEIVQFFPAKGPGGERPGDIMWDGRYYHVHNNGGKYNLYTTAGALAGQWTVAGWPAGTRAGGSTFSKSFNNAGGRYLFVSGTGRGYAFDMNDGSLLASWGMFPPGWAQSYGDAYPSSYGGALWRHTASYIPPIDWDHWAYQVDVDARGATNVVPASVGKIKAMNR